MSALALTEDFEVLDQLSTVFISKSSPSDRAAIDLAIVDLADEDDSASNTPVIPVKFSATIPTTRNPVQVSFVALQEWEGHVTEMDGDSFSAILLDVTKHSGEELATFPLDEISDSDQKLLKPGAIFRWSIGYERLRGGTKRKVSSIVFRRLPAWSKRDLLEIEAEATLLEESLIWE
ncbi:hypothetical protein N5C60_26455 [Pseudomonas mosselii]|uniref:hypothetical protein n=1 Tax=Pseudomonas mosselii TaxID=78327 RepID=UPI00244A9159|nr:hypothetical protein [Pseudomonas mosselii]MDH1148136.1 hypothetical protein [Pseudomonas mosselii]